MLNVQNRPRNLPVRILEKFKEQWKRKLINIKENQTLTLRILYRLLQRTRKQNNQAASQTTRQQEHTRYLRRSATCTRLIYQKQLKSTQSSYQTSFRKRPMILYQDKEMNYYYQSMLIATINKKQKKSQQVSLYRVPLSTARVRKDTTQI